MRAPTSSAALWLAITTTLNEVHAESFLHGTNGQLKQTEVAKGHFVTNTNQELSDGRIINGEDAIKGRFPWFVWYFFGRSTGPGGPQGEQCGGALIAPDLFLTAAHCVADSGGDIGEGYVGKYNTQDINEGGPVHEVESILPHPGWVPGNIPYDDIMLVKFEEPVPDPTLIRLNFDDDFPSDTGAEMLMLGFGSVTNGRDEPYQTSQILQQAPTEYVSNFDCSTARDPDTGHAYGNSPDQTAVTDSWFCNLLTDPEITAHCKGDSGGPIIHEGDTVEDDLLLATISGSSGGCGNQYLPGLNQRVSYHAEWITTNGCELSVAPPSEWNCPSSPTVSPTMSPVSPTQAPVSPTRAPVSPTSAPVSPTSAPISPTNSPISPTNAPISPTNSPVSPTNAPMSPTISPVSPTGAPASPTSSPTHPTDTTPTSSPGTLPPNSPPTEPPAVVTEDDDDIGGDDDVTGVPVYIDIFFGDEPRDIGWFIADEAYGRFRVGVPAGAYRAGEEEVEDVVYVRGGEAYMFTIEDKSGNGLAGDPPGRYDVFLGNDYGGTLLAYGAGDFGHNETTIFWVPEAQVATVSPGTELPTWSTSQPTQQPTIVPGTQTSNPTPSPTADPNNLQNPGDTAARLSLQYLYGLLALAYMLFT